MATQLRKSITVEVTFTASELRAIRRFYGDLDGNYATTSQLQRFVQDEIAQSGRKVVEDYGPHTSPTFNGREIKWHGDGYYRYSPVIESYVWVSENQIREFESRSIKVIFIQKEDVWA